jgi:hypothetical protein
MVDKIRQSNVEPLIVCSIPLKKFSDYVPEVALPWIHRIVKFPVHTFVVEHENAYFLDAEETDGYWY